LVNARWLAFLSCWAIIYPDAPAVTTDVLALEERVRRSVAQAPAFSVGVRLFSETFVD